MYTASEGCMYLSVICKCISIKQKCCDAGIESRGNNKKISKEKRNIAYQAEMGKVKAKKKIEKQNDTFSS